jgi:hypothetical protein
MGTPVQMLEPFCGQTTNRAMAEEVALAGVLGTGGIVPRVVIAATVARRG